ncbi:iron-sulfur cluster repair di-iron protein [Vulgatibacter sp.]|uniref:iron-sulfur cluster repair di-iron protein n=1 Tax=Vulgatibacter sp. TaxID=1971226 RepID=UPI0035688E44
MIDRTATIARIVLDHPASARVFQANRIDFCCGGNVTVDEICAKKALDPAAIWAALEEALAERSGDGTDGDVRELGTDALIARIVDRHHGYLRKALPWLVPLATKVARVHGVKEPRLVEIRDLVVELHDLLLVHLEEEEQELFPALVREARDPAFVAAELEQMQAEHLEVGSRLERLRQLTDDYEAPAWGCSSYRTLFAELGDLEGDVLRHVHLENHVLLPRFI